MQEAQNVTELVARWRYYQKALVVKAKLLAIGYIQGHVTQGKPPLPEDMKDQVQELFGIQSTWPNTTASVRFAFLPDNIFDLAKKLEIMYYEEKLKGQRFAKSSEEKKEREVKEKEKADEEEAASASGVLTAKLGKRKRKAKPQKPKRPAFLKPIPRNFFESLATNLSQEDAYNVCLNIVTKVYSLEVLLFTTVSIDCVTRFVFQESSKYMKNIRKLTDFQAQILPLLECETPDEAEKKHPFFRRRVWCVWPTCARRCPRRPR